MKAEKKDEGGMKGEGGEGGEGEMQDRDKGRTKRVPENEGGLAGRQVTEKDRHSGSSYASDITMTSSYLDTLPCWVGVHAVVNVELQTHG